MALEEAHLIYKERPDGDWVHHDDYQALAAELAALKEQMRWRDVRVELPKLLQDVLVLCGSEIHTAWIVRNERADDQWMFSSGIYDGLSSIVSHWQPLPQPPKEQE